jgi:hypothetical protein
MGWVACEDPFVRRVREVYRANVLRSPRAGIRPLTTIARKGRHVELRGDLGRLLDGNEPRLPAAVSAPAADLSGSRSTDLDVGLGAQLTANFLDALGLPVPAANVEATLLRGSRAVSFEVRDVREHRVDVGALGDAVRGRRVDPAHPAARAVFFGDHPADMLVISRILTSPSFVLRTTRSARAGATLELDAFHDQLGAGRAALTWSVESDGAVVFGGAQRATFAFAAIRCHLDGDGALALGLEVDATFGDGRNRPVLVAVNEPAVDDDGLLELDAAEP